MLWMLLAASIDANAALFLSSCDKELTEECGAYLKGFTDAVLAYNFTAKMMKERDERIIVPRLVCSPRTIDMEQFRQTAVRSVKDKPTSDPLPSYLLMSLSKLYPCK